MVTSRDTDHFYRISLEEENKITFYYRLEDGEFDVQMSLPENKTFCDGLKHSREFKRYGKIVTFKADGGLEYKADETRIRKVIFSKPDRIVLGGIKTHLWSHGVIKSKGPNFGPRDKIFSGKWVVHTKGLGRRDESLGTVLNRKWLSTNRIISRVN